MYSTGRMCNFFKYGVIWLLQRSPVRLYINLPLPYLIAFVSDAYYKYLFINLHHNLLDFSFNDGLRCPLYIEGMLWIRILISALTSMILMQWLLYVCANTLLCVGVFSPFYLSCIYYLCLLYYCLIVVFFFVFFVLFLYAWSMRVKALPVPQ